MSNPHELWYGYIETILKRYPNIREREKKAIDKALEDLKAENAIDVLNFADLYYFKKKYDVRGTAKALYVVYDTALRWKRKLMKKVAINLKLTDP